MKILLITLFLLTGCATEYRTDYEITKGIELTQEQLEQRIARKQLRNRAIKQASRNVQLRESLGRCHGSNDTVECLRQ